MKEGWPFSGWKTGLKLTNERVSTGIGPYSIDVSGDGKWAVVGNAGLGGLAGRTSPGDADLVTLIDVSKRPFRAAQHLTVPPCRKASPFSRMASGLPSSA